MNFPRTLFLVVILLTAFGITQLAHHSQPIASKFPFDTFPMKVKDWKGVPAKMDQREYEIAGVEDYVLASFYRQGHAPIHFYLGYYESQKQGDTIHSPKNCLPGSGWNILESGTVKVHIPGKKLPVTLAQMLLGKGKQRQMVLYWFHSRGRIISSEYMQKIWLVTDSIFRHRTDGSFVRITCPVTRDREHTIEEMKPFVQAIFPVLDQYMQP